MHTLAKGGKRHYEGIITITRSGTGFFSIGENKEDMVIPRESLGTAFPGDTVRVVEDGFVRGRINGKVISVLKRAHDTFVGTLSVENERAVLIPDMKRMYTSFIISGEHPDTGHKVLVRFTHWGAHEELPTATVEEDIGIAGVHETEMRALALGEGFNPSFPAKVTQEALNIEKEGGARIVAEIARGTRRDFRDTTTFTIDPVDAKDFDDALSVKMLPDGKVEVGIHIADVSFFVTDGTAIDTEARSRSTSVYLVDRTIPMLPEILSNDLCSLKQNEDRLTMSAVFVLDAHGNVHERWFGETIINSNRRFTYEDAQKSLESGQGDFAEELKTLNSIAKNIRIARVASGAIEFDTAEVKIELDNAGKPIAIHLKERYDTNLLIEDFMLLANTEVAQKLTNEAKKRGLSHSFMYRVHDAPDPDRIENLSLFLRVLGYHLEVHAGKVKGTDLNAIIEKSKGIPKEYLIKTAILRSMAKAVYTTKNIGHYGLAFTSYTHFTSPIRRYPDMLVHRALKHYTQDTLIPQKDLDGLEEVATHSSEREVAASHAERDSIKMKQVEFLAPHVGDEFDAVISGVTERGIYIEENTTHADGMVRITLLGDDYFEYDSAHYRLVGQRTKKTYTLGDPIRVKLIAARVAEKELDFSVASSS
ncbi:MAG TPA: ribonuclease R [Candidatus Kaiserbacteria bacterium]|nr:ribonuclease R [Candidatus Kaiserbacteria bacterium]